MLRFAELGELIQDGHQLIGQGRVSAAKLLLGIRNKATVQLCPCAGVLWQGEEGLPGLTSQPGRACSCSQAGKGRRWRGRRSPPLLSSPLQEAAPVQLTINMVTRRFFLATWAWEKMHSSTGLMSGMCCSLRMITHLS